ncbi:MAG: hypothetical protein EZS28_027302, partial [Streblomastix strix]
GDASTAENAGICENLSECGLRVYVQFQTCVCVQLVYEPFKIQFDWFTAGKTLIPPVGVVSAGSAVRKDTLLEFFVLFPFSCQFLFSECPLLEDNERAYPVGDTQVIYDPTGRFKGGVGLFAVINNQIKKSAAFVVLKEVVFLDQTSTVKLLTIDPSSNLIQKKTASQSKIINYSTDKTINKKVTSVMKEMMILIQKTALISVNVDMQGLTTIVAVVYASIEAAELTAGEVVDVVESVASTAVAFIVTIITAATINAHSLSLLKEW